MSITTAALLSWELLVKHAGNAKSTLAIAIHSGDDAATWCHPTPSPLPLPSPLVPGLAAIDG